MRNIIPIALIVTLSIPLTCAAGPGGHGGPGGNDGPGRPDGGPGMIHHGGGKHSGTWLSVLPDIATALLIGGVTYWVVNGTYYQQADNGYVVVERPSDSPSTTLQVLDLGGKRYYVQQGHYYVRDINGNYTEVPRPAGL